MGKYDGPERRRLVPATRRFVIIAASVVMVYVTFVFWFSSTRTSDGDLRDAVRQVQTDSCDAGNKIRDDVGAKRISCAGRLNRLPK